MHQLSIFFLTSTIRFRIPTWITERKKLLTDYMNDVKIHDKKPKVVFSTSGLSILSVFFRNLGEKEQTVFLKVLKHLKDALTQSLASCLHYTLHKMLMEENFFWPEVANLIDFTLPPKTPSMMIAQVGYIT